MIVGVPKETFPGERRVAIVPASIPALVKCKLDVVVERGAGAAAGYPDAEYEAKGASLVDSRDALFEQARLILMVRTLGANPDCGASDLPRLGPDHVLLGFSDPLGRPDCAKSIAETKATSFSMELIPRISRAQSMDALSSMATIAGYKAVLMAAGELHKIFPMLMTAAGTVRPARIFIIGAGVAGLQAIATARRLGAVVQAYDVRDVVKEQIESLGAKFVQLDVDAGASEDAGGYAKELDESFYRRQRETMRRVVADSDVVITTAAIPGKKSPVLITADMVEGMPGGAVIVDLAAERGGNCELTRADERVDAHGVTIFGPTNLPSTIPMHASQMYSRNLDTIVQSIVKEGELVIDLEDEVVAGCLVTRDGAVVHERVQDLLGEAPAKADPDAAPAPAPEKEEAR